MTDRSATRSERVKLFAIAAVALLLLLTPAILNRGPIYWFDTLTYLHGGGTAIEVVTGQQTRYHVLERGAVPLAQHEGQADSPIADAPEPVAENEAREPSYRISAARSPYYSVALVALSQFGGPFAPVLVNAGLLLLAGMALLLVMFDTPRLSPALWLLAATAMSTKGIFAALLMPDALAPLAILAMAVFFAFHGRMGIRGKLFWATLLVTSAISHSTHLAVALLLLPIGAVLARFVGRSAVVGPMLWCAGALGIAISGGIVFSQTVKAVYGYKPLALPMIAASLITDQPGRSFLQEHCPEIGYVYCDQLHTRATETDQFLWSKDPDVGVYLLADAESRRLMSEQQFGFLLDTLRYDPVGQLTVSLKRFWRQLFDNRLNQMTYNSNQLQALRKLPEPDRSVAVGSGLYQGTLSFESFGRLAHFISVFAALATFGMMVMHWAAGSKARPFKRDASLRGLTVFTLLVICALLLNAGLTGAASQPQGRYAARVAMLLPVLVSLWGAWTTRRLAAGKSNEPFNSRLSESQDLRR